MSDREIDVWTVEDNALFRETLRDLIERTAGMRCTLAADSCEQAIGALHTGNVPHVVLMDLGLPGMKGVDGIARIHEISPTTHIVVLTIHEEDDNVFAALCAGAHGYLLKPSTSDRIIDAIHTAVSGGAPMNAFIARRVLNVFTRQARPRGDYGLTAREREILLLLVDGPSQKQIAKLLSLSPHTVDTHLRNIYAKLHVHTRSAAVAKALQERLV